jgi:hypothetical protein
MPEQYPDAFLELLAAVKGKRPRTLIDHVLKHGSITSEELRERYGYSHPPRVARDVREAGIPLETFKVKGSDGRTIAAYRFGDPEAIRPRRVDGRTAASDAIKQALADAHGSRCFIYLEEMPLDELQIDHRIPYEIAGDASTTEPAAFMLLSPAANRAKSWACEHCPNWTARDADVCRSCYWAFPASYEHVATLPVRRLDLLWKGEDVADYDRVKQRAEAAGSSAPAYIKALVAEALRGDSE